MKPLDDVPRFCLQCGRTTYTTASHGLCEKCKRKKLCYACGKPSTEYLDNGRCKQCSALRPEGHSRVSIYDTSRPDEATLEERIVYYGARADKLDLFADLHRDLLRAGPGEVRNCCYCRSTVRDWKPGEVVTCKDCSIRSRYIDLDQIFTVEVKRCGRAPKKLKTQLSYHGTHNNTAE